MDGELQDWEVLHNSDDTRSLNSSDADDHIRALEGIDAESEGMIRNDYFSPDSQIKYAKTTVTEGDATSVESDNPSWIDPVSDNSYARKESGEFWPDSGSDRSDDRKFSEIDAHRELGFVENAKEQVVFEGIEAKGDDLGKFWYDSGGIEPISMEFGGLKHRAEMSIGHNTNSPKGSELTGEENGGDVKAGGDTASSGKESVAVGAVKPSGGEEKRTVVWWKVPFEFLKYCAFRVSPVWTFSVAAAVMGFVILGRRMYKMKRKSQSLQLKVTMDDKKVSQFMSRVARFNEAFSLVKRVPVIRPSLPAAGVTPWPVMSLR